MPALLFLFLSLLGCGEYEDKEVFYVERCDGKEYNTSTQICDYGEIKDIWHNKCYDKSYDRSIQYCDNGVVRNKETFIDERDGKTYKSIKIGNQLWMAENLKYESPNSRCYNDEPANCEIFGKMYDWKTAKIACPNGWHLPNDNDFLDLSDFVEGISECWNCAGIMLKANSDLWASNKGRDEFGFTALPGGYHRDNYSGFAQKNMTAGFWSATEGSMQGSAHFRYFTSSTSSLSSSLNLDGFYVDNALANVRCIGD